MTYISSKATAIVDMRKYMKAFGSSRWAEQRPPQQPQNSATFAFCQ